MTPSHYVVRESLSRALGQIMMEFEVSPSLATIRLTQLPKIPPHVSLIIRINHCRHKALYLQNGDFVRKDVFQSTLME